MTKALGMEAASFLALRPKRYSGQPDPFAQHLGTPKRKLNFFD